MKVIQELAVFANSMSIMVIENNKEYNKKLVNTLNVFFKSVDFAYDEKEALEKYKISKPDIIIIDASNIVLLRKVKKIYQNQAIIILSSHRNSKLLSELTEYYFDSLILKPFNKHALLYKLLKVAEKITYQKEFDIFFKEKYKAKRAINKKELNAGTTSQISKETIKETPQEKVDIPKNDNYHFSHKKEDASDFLNSIENDNLIWQAFQNDIPELLQLSSDFSEDIDKIDLDGFSSDVRDSIAQIIHEYILIFSTLDQMIRMTEVLSQLTQFLEELDVDSLSEKQLKKLKFIGFIYEDIDRFLQTVFVYKDTVDIYYLEDSLESSITRLKNDVLGIEVEEEELELF